MRSTRLSQNLFTLLLSLALAFFLWVIATETENPTQEKSLPQAFSLQVKGLDSSLIAYGHETVRVKLTARAPQSVWENFQNSDVAFFIDVTGLGPGIYTLPIEVQFKRLMRVVRLQPEQVTIQIEPVLTREVPVEVLVQGTPALGYQALTPTLVPQKVVITGPASSVSRAVAARVVLDVNERRQSLQGDYGPVVVDKAGTPLPYITCDPLQISVALTIEQLGNYRDMAIKVRLTGQPAAGYRITRVEVDPPIVTAFGSTELIRSLEGFIETVPVSLNQLTEPISVTARLQVPEGLSILLPAPQVQVVVHIEPIQGSVTLERVVELQGASFYSVTVAPATVSLILSGPLPVLDRLDPNTVHAMVDVSGLGPGVHTLKVNVIVPPNLKVESAIPETLSVTISTGP